MTSKSVGNGAILAGSSTVADQAATWVTPVFGPRGGTALETKVGIVADNDLVWPFAASLRLEV